MFRQYSPGVQLFSLITARFLSLFKSSKKARRPRPNPESSHSRGPYCNLVQKVVAAHTDCTAEVFNIFVSGADKVRVFSELTPGDRVELRLRGGEVAVYTAGKYMATPLLPDSSRLHSLVESDTDIDAFLGGRDVTNCSDEAEFCSIIAFYKIDGVLPTHVLIE